MICNEAPAFDVRAGVSYLPLFYSHIFYAISISLDKNG